MKLRNFSLIPAALSAAMVVMLVCGCSQTPPTGTLLLDYDPSSHNYGYVDSVGNVILPYKYVEAYEFDGSHAIVFSSEANAYSVIDKNGKEVLENLTSIGDFVNGFAKVTMDFTKVGIVNRQYEAVVPIGKYQRLDVPHSGIIRAWVETDHYFSDGYYVFLDTLGNELFHNKYDGIFEYSDSMLLVKSQGGYGFIDTEGREVIPCRYSRAEDFHEGRAAVRFNPSKFNQWGIIDKTGRTIVGPTYSEIKPFSDGLAAVCDGDNFGFIDKEGNMVIEPKYLDPEGFENGLAIVAIFNPMGSNPYGVIDKQGNEIIPIKNHYIKRLPGDYFVVEKNQYDDFSLYDSTGHEIFHEAFSGLPKIGSDGLIYAYSEHDGNNGYGVVTSSGKTIVPMQYPRIRPFKNGFALVTSSHDAHIGFVDMQGKLWTTRREAILSTQNVK